MAFVVSTLTGLPAVLRAQVSVPPDSATVQRATTTGIYLLHWAQKDKASE